MEIKCTIDIHVDDNDFCNKFVTYLSSLNLKEVTYVDSFSNVVARDYNKHFLDNGYFKCVFDNNTKVYINYYKLKFIFQKYLNKQSYGYIVKHLYKKEGKFMFDVSLLDNSDFDALLKIYFN